MMMGPLIKPPKKYINGQTYTKGETVKLTSTGDITGVAPLLITLRGAGGGGGADIEYTQQGGSEDDFYGERGAPGALNTINTYLSGSLTVYIGTGGNTPSGITATYPSNPTASDGTNGGSTYIPGSITASGGSGGDGAFVTSNGASGSNHQRIPLSVTGTNPDGSSSGRGAYGRPWGFPTNTYEPVNGAAWFEVGY